MTYLFVLNDAPYASERDYNALRLATALASDGNNAVTVFLLGDGVRAGVPVAPVPEGAHDIGWMLSRFMSNGSQVLACRTCLDARGILPGALMQGVEVSTLDCLARLTAESARVLVF